MSANKFLQFLIPKEKKFFPLFIEAGENLVQASEILIHLMSAKTPEERITFTKQIKELEHKGDGITHFIFDELSSTFITPFDRDDIHNLNSCIDDVVDFINGAAQRICMLNPREFSHEFHRMTELILEASREILIALSELKNLKNPAKIRESCIKINSIENHADDLYHHAISDLFEKESDVMELIKKKEIMEILEEATDRQEDVADILKSILIKMA
jgi:uncharacterized protein